MNKNGGSEITQTGKHVFHYVSSLECMRGVRTLNLTRGCQFGCIYCYIQSYRSSLPHGEIELDESVVKHVEHELERMKTRRFFLSTSSDVMQPALLQKGITQKILRLLSKYPSNTTIWTKGSPYRGGKLKYPTFFDNMESPSSYHFEININTLDSNVQKKYEPGAASIPDRIKFLEHLREIGVRTSLRLDPLIPGISDSSESIEKIMQLCRELEIKSVFFSWLFLRNAIIANMKDKLGSEFSGLMSNYQLNEKSYLIARNKSGVLIMPSANYRIEKVKLFNEISDEYDIQMHLCHCKNKDLNINTRYCHDLVVKKTTIESYL